MSLSLPQLAPALDANSHLQRWVVGFSGGVDSTALLVAVQQYLSRYKADGGPQLLALHINHDLQPEAAQWEQSCGAFCAQRGIDFQALPAAVTDSGEGPEAAARKARYDAFKRVLRAGDALLLAHHRDDQAETFLLNLMRGSGRAGLAGIPGARAIGPALLLRPLLDTPRADLLAFAQQLNLDWIEDPSNADTQFDRNFIRSRVLPLLSERWAQASASIARASGIAAQESALLAEVAAEDLAKVSRDSGVSVEIDELLELSSPRRVNVLRYWLAGFDLQPRQSQLQELETSLIAAAVDAAPELRIGARMLRRFRNRIYCLEEFTAPPAFDWDPAQVPEINGWGRLVAQHAECGGLACHGDYRIQFRAGGERAQPSGRAHSTTLKHLFQEFAVPDWERRLWPLIYRGDALAAVPGLFICEGFEAGINEPGWYLRRDPINCAPF